MMKQLSDLRIISPASPDKRRPLPSEQLSSVSGITFG